MSATILSGRELAERIRDRTDAAARVLIATGTRPRLAVVLATADESSASYVRSLARSAANLGVACDVVDVGPAATTDDISDTLRRLSNDEAVHGIILQTPLPQHTPVGRLVDAIDPSKDVDGANPLSLGRLVAGQPAFAPATAEAVVALLDHHRVKLAGRHAVVVGRSNVVGKPAAHLLLDRDATVTVCHSQTVDLGAHTRGADVLVVAVGHARTITAEHVRAGGIVVDVGTNPDDTAGLVGDVDAVPVAEVAGGLTPVPGGVGPVTSMLLLEHTVRAAENLTSR